MSNNDTQHDNSTPTPSDGSPDPGGSSHVDDSDHSNEGGPVDSHEGSHDHDDHEHDHDHDHDHDDHDHDHDGHDHDDHDHGDDHHHDHEDGEENSTGASAGERARPRARLQKGPSENPLNMSEQLVAETLRGRRSKCSHGCGSDGGCSTGGCGVGSLVEMIANKFEYTDPRRIVEVTFPGYRRGFAAVDEDIPLRVRDTVIVRSANGTDWGSVSMTGSLVHAKRKAKRLSNEELPKLLRKADENDIKRIEQCKVSERHAFSVCRTRVESFNLPMILVGSEWQFDHKKLTFFFTADGRVDFRELVRDLAAIFNTRIELRQIPVRDAAKRIGGMGVCGLELCCTTHLGRYEHVTLDHAKIQQIPANPSKLSGQCGRLKCCLLYEVDTYVEGLKRFPPLDSIIQTEVGPGVIQKIDLFRDLIHLYHAATSAWETLTLEDYRDILAGRKRKKETEPESVQGPGSIVGKGGDGSSQTLAERKEERKGAKRDDRRGGAQSRKDGRGTKDRPAQGERQKEDRSKEKGERRPEERRGSRPGGPNQEKGTRPDGGTQNAPVSAGVSDGGEAAKKRRRKKKKAKKKPEGQGQSQQSQASDG